MAFPVHVFRRCRAAGSKIGYAGGVTAAGQRMTLRMHTHAVHQLPTRLTCNQSDGKPIHKFSSQRKYDPVSCDCTVSAGHFGGSKLKVAYIISHAAACD